MIEVEIRASTNQSASPVMTNHDDCCDQDYAADYQVDHLNKSTQGDTGVGRSRETEYLVEFLGKVLQQVGNFFMIIVLVFLLPPYKNGII